MTRRLLAILLALVLPATGCSLQTLGAPTGHLTLYALFDDVQNLVAGHGVQMYDVRVGSVIGIRLQGYKARVKMSIVDGVHIPVGTTAVIAKTSLLGENYVRLEPPAGAVPRTSPALADGAQIAQTGVQPDLEAITERVGPVLAALTGENIDNIVNGLGTGLNGTGPQLRAIIQKADTISQTYAAAGQDLTDLIDGMSRLGSSLAKTAPALDRLPVNLATLTDRVQTDRAALKQALLGLTNLAQSANAVIRVKLGARLKGLLQRLNAILAAMLRGRSQLKSVANDLFSKLTSAPHVTYYGQALAYVWLGGFLPGSSKPAASTQSQLRNLLRPS